MKISQWVIETGFINRGEGWRISTRKREEPFPECSGTVTGTLNLRDKLKEPVCIFPRRKVLLAPIVLSLSLWRMYVLMIIRLHYFCNTVGMALLGWYILLREEARVNILLLGKFCSTCNEPRRMRTKAL